MRRTREVQRSDKQRSDGPAKDSTSAVSMHAAHASPGSNTCLGARTSRLRVERAGELQLVQGTGGRESSIAMAGPPPVNAITPVHRSGGVDWEATLSEERPAENLVSE
jgi:hypothetical protein